MHVHTKQDTILRVSTIEGNTNAMNAAQARALAYGWAAEGLRKYIESGGLDEYLATLPSDGHESYYSTMRIVENAVDSVIDELIHGSKQP